MSGRPRTAAALPGPGYKRPRQVSESGLVVSVVTEDGSKSKTFNFSNVDAPEQLVLDLVASFAKLSGPGGRWRSMSSIQAGEGMVRHLAATLPQISPEVKRAKDVSPEVWWQWRYAIEKKDRAVVLRWLARHDATGHEGQGQAAQVSSDLRLLQSEGVPEYP